MIKHRHIRLDERALYYFMAVEECGSMRQAADRIRISASAISRKISELELDLGVALFEKSPKGVHATEAGARLAGYIQDRNRRDREIILELANGEMLKGEVRLAIGEGFLAGLVEYVLPEFRTAFPHVNLQLEVAGSGDIIEAIERDVVDVGVLFARIGPTSSDIWLRKTHALHVVGLPKGREIFEPLSLTAVGATPVALLSPGFGLRALIDKTQHDLGFRLDVALECNSVQAAEIFATSGQGITFLPRFAFHQVQTSTAVLTDPRLAAVAAELHVKHGRKPSLAARALIQFMAAHHPAFQECVAQ